MSLSTMPMVDASHGPMSHISTLQETIEFWMGAAAKWDEPEIDKLMVGRSAD